MVTAIRYADILIANLHPWYRGFSLFMPHIHYLSFGAVVLILFFPVKLNPVLAFAISFFRGRKTVYLFFCMFCLRCWLYQRDNQNWIVLVLLLLQHCRITLDYINHLCLLQLPICDWCKSKGLCYHRKARKGFRASYRKHSLEFSIPSHFDSEKHTFHL